MNKKSKHNTEESHQTMREVSQRVKKEQLQKYPENINKMAMGTQSSITILKVN